MNKVLLLLLLFLNTFAFSQKDEFFVRIVNIRSVDRLQEIPIISDYYCPFRHRDMQSVFYLKLNQPISTDQLRREISAKMDIIYLEEVPEIELFYIPNDLQTNQYALSVINATQAWDLNLDASSARIAVIDDAIDLTHPDLSGNVWINTGEIPGDGIDNDFNGFTDDVNGWDFANNDNNPNPPSSSLYHGTHVTGIASARTDNGAGIASIGMNAKIVPIKIGLDATGGLTGGPQAVDYAIAMGVDVINMSWGGSIYSQIYQDLFDIAYNEDIVCVAAAGNSSTNLPMYPASYNHVISVASTTSTDQVSSFSNFGPTVDLAAPGSGIYSTLVGAQYGNLSGTSMASPCVAGLVALMRDANPLATVDEIEACLLSTCDPISGPLSNQIGAGRINAYEAMLCITELTAEFTSDLTQVCPGNSIQFFNYSAWPGTTYSWSFPGGIPSTSNLQNPTVTYPNGGTFDVTLTVTNGANSQTLTLPNYVTISEPTAVISGVSSIISGGYGSVSVSLTGIPPYSITINDGTTNYPISGILSSPYVHFFNPTTDTDYTLTSFSDSQCSGITSGMGSIAVSPIGTASCDSVAIAFTKYLGTNIDDNATGIADLGQHGYLVLGRKQFSATNMRSYICRLDKCGNVLWENIYDENTYGIPIAGHIDGNELFICAYHGPSSTNVRTLLMRLDLNGNVIDAKRIAGNNNTTYPRYMVKSSSGDYILGMVTNASNFTYGANDNYVVRTQPNGTVVWQQRIGTSNSEFLHNIYEDNLGNVLTTGYLIEGALRSGYLIKLSPTGTLLWSRKFNMGTGYTYFTEVIELNGFYYAVGRTEVGTYGGSDGIIVKLDLSGNIIWSKKVGGTGSDQLVGIDTYNDTLFMLGRSNTNAASQEVLLVKYDQSGNMISYGSFGTPVDDTQVPVGKTISTTSNGNWLGISSGNAGVLGGYDITLFNVNSFADLCQPSTVIIQSSDIALQSQLFNVAIQSPNWTFSSVSIPVSPVISNQGFACINITTTPCTTTADFSASTVTCINDSVQFTDLSTAGGPYVNHWNFGDGLSSGFVDSGNIAHLYSSPGVYDVELIVVDTTQGCSDTIMQSITVNSNPAIDLPDTLFACLNDTLLIDLIETCLSSQATITWQPDSIIVDYQGNDVVIEVGFFGYVTVTVDDNGVILTDSIYIAESNNCCTSLAIIDPPSATCVGESIIFTESSITNGPANYNWSFLPDGNPINWNGPTPPSIDFATSGIKQVALVLSDNCGTLYDTLTFSIVDPPIFDLGPDLFFCQDTILQLGDTLIDNWMYLWSPGAAVSDSISSNPTASINVDQIITVVVTDPWTGCSTFDTLFVSMDSTEIDLGSDLTFCSDTSFQLGLTEEPNYTYQWEPVAIVSDPFIADPIISVSSTETLIIQVTDTLSGCSTWDTLEIAVEPVSIDLGSDFIFCDDTTLVLGPSANPDYTYLWQPATVSDPFAPNPTLTISGTETIIVQVTSLTSGCSDSDTVVYSTDPVFVDILTEDTTLCSPTNLLIEANQSGVTDLLWQTSSTLIQQGFNSATVELNGNTIVYATAFSASGLCSDTDSLLVDFLSPPDPIFIDTTICENESLIYHPASPWFDGFQETNLITVTIPGIYYYIEEHNCGTIAHQITLNTLSCDCNVYIPNAFTPDGGKTNNTFTVVSDCNFEAYAFTIYDRWGELIFESFDINEVWDGRFKGKAVQDGVYTWKLTYIDAINAVPTTRVGHVVLIR